LDTLRPSHLLARHLRGALNCERAVVTKLRHPEKAGLRLRVVLSDSVALGPGRAELLEKIRDLGSISAAGRAMGMSYRRAWTLVAAIEKEFGAPAVDAKQGGAKGGGATLTPLGETLVTLFRQIEAKASLAVEAEMQMLHKLADMNR